MGVHPTLPFLRYALLTLLVTSAISAPAVNIPFGDMIIADFRSLPPPGFTKVGNLPGDQLITLELNLFGRDFPGLEKQLYAVSTPRSSFYGKYLSQEDVCASLLLYFSLTKNLYRWCCMLNRLTKLCKESMHGSLRMVFNPNLSARPATDSDLLFRHRRQTRCSRPPSPNSFTRKLARSPSRHFLTPSPLRSRTRSSPPSPLPASLTPSLLPRSLLSSRAQFQPGRPIALPMLPPHVLKRNIIYRKFDPPTRKMCSVSQVS